VVTNHCWWIWKGYRRFWNFESVINIYWSYVEKRAFPLFFSYVEVNFQNINIFGVTLAILLQMCIYMILRYNFNSCSADNNALRGNVWSNLLPFCWMNSYRCGSRIQVCHCMPITLYLLQRKSHLCIPFLGIARPQSQFSLMCLCERFIYFQDHSTYFLQQNKQIIVGIYKSLTDTWMWKLVLRPRNSFSGNICSNFRCWFFALLRTQRDALI
jgi:hypothetical protein